MSIDKTKKGSFVEISYTGYANNKIFDSNISEDLKTLDEKAKPQRAIVVIGERMVVPGLDESLENKEIGKEYEITIKPKDAFGPRERNLIRTLPLNAFTSQKINPQVGMSLGLDGSIVKIIAISGARVITDFNHPLAGKDLRYKFKITRSLEEEKEKTEALLEFYFKAVPDYTLGDKIVVRGDKNLEIFIKIYSDRFKKLLGKEIVFEEKKKEKTEDKKESKNETAKKEKVNKKQ